MSDTRPGLLRIVAIDAHIPGRMIMLRMDGHANFTGPNGAGKTTLLKLIPLFYGAEPSRVMPRVGVKKPLVEYMLPRPTSMVVFEYQTPDGPVCAVMYRHVTGTKPAYRFVHSVFSPDLFQEERDGKRVLVESRQLAEFWRDRKIEFSPQLENIIDYRAVIQGDRSLIRRANDPHQLARLSAQYSVGGPGRSMSRMHLVTHAILGRKASLQGIHSLVAEILRENDLQLPSTHLSRSLADDIVNIKALYRVEENAAFLSRVTEEGVSYQAAQKELVILSGEIVRALAKVQGELDSLENQIEGAQEGRRSASSEWEQTYNELSAARVDIKHALDRLNKDIKDLEEERDRYEDEDAQARFEAVNNLNSLRRDRDEKLERLRSLEEGVQDVRRLHDEQCQTAERNHRDRDRALSERLETLRNEVRELERQREEVRSEAMDRTRRLKDNIVSQYRGQEAALKELMGELKALAASTIDTEEERLRIAEAESAVRDSEDRLRKLHDVRDNTAAAVDQGRQTQDREEKLYNEAHRVQKAVEAEKERLAAQLRPASGTWLSALHKEQPDWFNTLGRLVRPEVLSQAHLAPARAQPDSETVFGWALDLERLEKPDWAASLEDLQLQFEACEERLVAAEEQAGASHKRLRLANAALEEARKHHERARQDVVRQGAAVDSARQASDSTRHECQQAAARRCNEAALKLEATRKAYGDRVQERDQLLAAEETALSERTLEIAAQFAIDISSKNHAIDRLVSERAEAKKVLKATLRQLAQDYKDRCAGRGLDEVVLNQAMSAAQAAQTRVQEVEADRDYVADFKRWQEKRWPLHSQLLAQQHNQQEAFRQAESDIQNEKSAHNERMREWSTSIRSLQEQCSRLKLDETTLKDWRIRLPEPEPDNTGTDHRHVALLESEAERLVSERDRLRKSISRGMTRAEAIFCQGADTSRLRQAWEVMREDVRNRLLDPNNQDDLNINMTQAIDRLFREQVPQMREVDTLSVINAGTQLAGFFKGLRQVQDQIRRQSNEISNAIAQRMNFSALEDVRLHLVSRIEQQEFWPELERFAGRWEEWERQRGVDMPPLDLCDLLLSMSALVSRSRLGNDIEEVFTLQISLVENGQRVVVNNTQDMEGVSSNGLSYLVLLSIYAGITRMLCRDMNVRVHWPVDELGVLSHDNVAPLFRLFDDAGIVMVGGFPTTDRGLLQHFKHHHGVRGSLGVLEFQLPEDRLDRLLAERGEQRALKSAPAEETLA